MHSSSLTAPMRTVASAGHETQTATLLARDSAEYVPCGQGMHERLLVAAAFSPYVPEGQGVHIALEFAPGTSENVPGGHGKQPPAPSGALYQPAAHSVHIVPSRLVPGRQAQAPTRSHLASGPILLSPRLPVFHGLPSLYGTLTKMIP